MMARIAFVVAGLWLPVAVFAQEFIETRGKLTDEAFYRLIACAAPPGGACQKPLARWPEHRVSDLTLSIVTVDEHFPLYRLRLVEAGLDSAIQQINAAGSAVRLRRTENGTPADINIFMTETPAGDRVRGTGLPGLDGEVVQAALVMLWWRGQGEVTRAAIAVSRDIRRRSIPSVMLEELVQALGLTTDIRNPYYTKRSIFSEDGNSVARLAAQDLAVLRRHYPLEPPKARSASQ